MDASFGTSIGLLLPRSVHRPVMLLSNTWQFILSEVEGRKDHTLVRSVLFSTELL
jgi:hypothetical protein